ncbi:GroES-like family protein [Striga hermonthica]|uniref:GroES-like family protein n=1 Tax=Striga hermonthica TaxID=68872 RepID=A0A9N7R9P6_STRHE|nr:GroES-like family protein [Striga hermonthica]
MVTVSVDGSVLDQIAKIMSYLCLGSLGKVLKNKKKEKDAKGEPWSSETLGVQKSAGGVLLPKSAVKFEWYLMGEFHSIGAEVEKVETGKKVDLGTSDRLVSAKQMNCWLWSSEKKSTVSEAIGGSSGI